MALDACAVVGARCEIEHGRGASRVCRRVLSPSGFRGLSRVPRPAGGGPRGKRVRGGDRLPLRFPTRTRLARGVGGCGGTLSPNESIDLDDGDGAGPARAVVGKIRKPILDARACNQG